VRTQDGVVGIVREKRADGAVVIEAGALRVVVASSAILEQSSTAPGQPQPTARAPDRPSVAVGTEVSLRGLRADEAEAELSRALDAAILADLPYLRIIHGKGTGALRGLVQRVLEADPRVARWGFPPASQGGWGVTVVEFRA
jgi:DNA mismatch repair protein MutS2